MCSCSHLGGRLSASLRGCKTQWLTTLAKPRTGWVCLVKFGLKFNQQHRQHQHAADLFEDIGYSLFVLLTRAGGASKRNAD